MVRLFGSARLDQVTTGRMTEIAKVRFFGRPIVEVMLDVISISAGND